MAKKPLGLPLQMKPIPVNPTGQCLNSLGTFGGNVKAAFGQGASLYAYNQDL